MCRALSVSGHVQDLRPSIPRTENPSAVFHIQLCRSVSPQKWTERSRKVPPPPPHPPPPTFPPPPPSAARGNGLVCADGLWCGFSVWAPVVSYPQVENLSDCVGTSLLQLSTAGVAFHFYYIFLPFFFPHAVPSHLCPGSFTSAHLQHFPPNLPSWQPSFPSFCLTHRVVLQSLTPMIKELLTSVVTFDLLNLLCFLWRPNRQFQGIFCSFVHPKIINYSGIVTLNV